MTDESSQREVEAWLSANRDTLFDHASVDGEHLDDARLAAVADAGDTLTPAELEHLARCAECREVHAALGLRSNVVTLAPRRVGRWLGVAGIAAAAAIAVVVLRAPEAEEYRARGDEASELSRASVALVATSTAGVRRDLREGATIHRGERLGFRYGNPGAHRTLTVLAWDGRAVHWLYPEHAADAPPTIESGPRALNRRLPFDVVIDDDFDDGPLTVVAAFDAEPRALAERLRSEAPPEGVTVVRIRVAAAR